jgi:NAD(P)-dependent dehydrogenase (short-subunit alcohol dehydrogenase family)
MSKGNGRVADKIALVTGAGSGLGRCFSQMLVAEGARVVMTDIDGDAVSAAAAEIGDAAHALAHDVTDEGRWQEVVAEAVSQFGGLHVLVNNAGIGPFGSVEETDFATWKKVHDIDLDGVFLGCKYALSAMAESCRDQKVGGSIINISSIAGIIASGNMIAYNSAKAAVRHLSKSMALHCARKGYPIRCNSVHPAFVDTPILDQDWGQNLSRDERLQKLGRQLPLGNVGKPEDIGYAVVYLASDESAFMTGAEMVLDGGVSAM